LVPRSHHDEIVELVKQNLAMVPYGDPADPGTYMGPLISERQRDKVDDMVQRAVQAGATLVAGGKKIDGPGFFYSGRFWWSSPTTMTTTPCGSPTTRSSVCPAR
jgi:acyl-CoA reductase-like NAD-dependent aldehyde dehydrogenase